MKKRILSVFMAMAVMFTMIQTVSVGVAGSDFVIDQNGVLIEYRGAGGDVVIPNGVTSIGYRAFGGCTSLTSIIIPVGVTSIVGGAFFGCTNLTDVTIPNSVTSIGNSAFYSCTSLTEVTIPDGVTSIENMAFIDCTSLDSITFPDSVASMGSSVFRNTPWLDNQSDGMVYIGKIAYIYKGNMPKNTSITLNPGTKGIAGGAFLGITFMGQPNLTEIIIPDSVTSIGFMAFEQCTSLTEIKIPGSVTSIGGSAFNFCTSLTEIIIPAGVTSIEHLTLGNCTNLTEIKIPNSVTSIDRLAFAGCESLTEITIPGNVTSIEQQAFRDCTSLSSITIPDSVTKIGEDAFRNTAWLNEQPNGVVYAGKVAYGWKGDMPENTSIVLRTDTKAIADSAFALYYKNFKDYANLKSITIPFGVMWIGISAFGHCTGLTSVVIPDSVVSIETGTFQYCAGLTTVTIGKGVKSVDSGAFYSCTSLTSITIPANVESIDGAFRLCSSLAEINVNSANKAYSSVSGVLFDKTQRELIRYPAGKTNSSYTIPESVIDIKNGAFDGCNMLKSITIPDSVMSIGENSFADCTSLTKVTIPSSVAFILSHAFLGCTSLTEITIQNSAANIRDEAFGFQYGTFGTKKIIGLVVYGIKGSTAETYANRYGFEFCEIGSKPTHNPNTCTLHVCAFCDRSCPNLPHICDDPLCGRTTTCGAHVCGRCGIICDITDCPICNGGNPDRVPCDKGCCDPDNLYVAVRGHILANEEIAIFDALEILKALVNMDGAIKTCPNAKIASLITDESQNTKEPSIFDALEILKHLVNMPSKVEN